MRTLALLLAATGAVALGASTLASNAQPAKSAADVQAEMQRRGQLKPASAFASIADPNARSVALFQEMGKVITHPRCMNCHPVDTPIQGDNGRRHIPLVVRGDDGHGSKALPCAACHTAQNVDVMGENIRSVPGHPLWHLAPKEMAWEGKSLGEICAQIKDPARNGGKTLAQIHEHMAQDSLVGWGWDPGRGRNPAPGTQAQFGELTKAWIDTGARCPAARA